MKMLRRFVLTAVLACLAMSSVALAQIPQAPQTYRVGGTVKAPRKIVDVPPVYPELARAQGAEGVVILELTLDTTGAVESARVIRSVPLLDQAALDAVRQWKYEPSLVNDAPARITYNITVSFSLKAASDTLNPAQPADATPNSPATADVPTAPTVPPVPDVPTDAASAEPAPVRVGGAVRAPMKITDVPPVYPAVALQAQVQGVVILELLVAPSGVVRDAKVIRSVPLLDGAALEAVRQWVYQPTLLNGVAVPVYYNVTVSFTTRQ